MSRENSRITQKIGNGQPVFLKMPWENKVPVFVIIKQDPQSDLPADLYIVFIGSFCIAYHIPHLFALFLLNGIQNENEDKRSYYYT